MVSRSLVMQRIRLTPFIVALLPFLLAGCPTLGGGSAGSSGITIAQNDSTPPTLNLGAGQPDGQNVTVNASGSTQNMRLTNKTGVLNLLATAEDTESGVQALEIWLNKQTISCNANGNCNVSGPGLLGKPSFESTSPRKQPGETTAASSILAQTLDLTKEIPQGSVSAGNTLTVNLIIYAVAANHLGGRTQTATITATWSEP